MSSDDARQMEVRDHSVYELKSMPRMDEQRRARRCRGTTSPSVGHRQRLERAAPLWCRQQ